VDGKRLLAIYLNDHLAGSAAGRALAARSLGNNKGTPYGDTLAWFLQEVEQDAEALREVMRRVGAHEDPLKQIAALVTERIGRLKLNGRLVGYSPLSRMVEIEGLVLGVRGKQSMWEVLDALELPELADMPFDTFIERAESQVERLRATRSTAAADAFLG
jgi:hypothetical protein